MVDSFLLSQPFVQKIRSTIERVNGTPLPGAGGVKRGPILEDPGVQTLGKVFRIATFDGSWNKGTSKTVTFQSGGATATAVNLFADVNTAADSGVNCAVAKDGAVWFLIASEC